MAGSQKPFYIALAAVVVGGAIFIATRLGGGHPISIPVNAAITAADTSGFRGYILGSPDAPVEVTEYADFECPGCAAFDAAQFPDVKARLIDPGKIRLRFRDFPLDAIHKYTRIAAHSAACADDQHKFWDVKPVIFARQNDWAYGGDPMPVMRDIMKNAGLDMTQWNACMVSAKYAGRIQASLNEGSKLGVPQTPTFVIAGQMYPGLSAEGMVKIVDSLIAASPQHPAPAGRETPTPGQ